ncbi:NAD-dependent epimerase/dehydratase family protein [Plantactinospora sp. KLBMP9567]|uniref:NAD-dependent epimerase/dehydratase family protein n=1 Tax=Plantactinospora sp. KLBMP9567 TaxID=3085900 RepID=UPI002980B834|nr:NAD-dependent epimerase/dehydratase family protein [Plantactinospora sp. KLBMP9567]MDW5325734.1 NAD-dependent epimerase/dehydratase family protein [Plantactinospora sp. KLBMP9567]
MFRVLVTGAAGFIGSHLVDALLARGVTVIGLDRRRLGEHALADENLAAAVSNPSFTPCHLDLATDQLDDVVKGCETVFHLAARPGVRQSWGSDFLDYAQTNVLGTHRLLDACVRQGVRRLVFASSSSVYGPTNRPSREGDPTCPISPYGVSKLAAEHLCLAYARRPDSQLSVVALRYFTVYGPRQRPDMLIGRILFSAYTGFPMTLFGDGSQHREFTYISDVVTATIAAAHLDVRATAVNVGGGASVSMRGVIDEASKVTGRQVPIKVVPAQPGDVPATAADLTRAGRLLGYWPTVGLHEGLARQAAWLVDLSRDRLATFTS